MKIVGIFVMLLGIGLTIFSSISYFTREKVLQIGSLELSNHPQQSISWSPFIGIAIMVIGAFLVMQAKKK